MARILKPIGQYSARKARRYLVVGLIFLIPFVILFLTANKTPLHIQLNELATTSRGFYMGFFFTIGALLIMYPYRHWRSGLKGEKRVIKNLADKLSDQYSIFNNVLLKGGKRGGDIDHIVVGPTGVFVIETKNNQESVYFNGYQWKNISRSPSEQVVNNMFRVKDALLNCDVFKEKEPYVYAIVVFSNGKLKIKIDQAPKWCEIIQLKNPKDNSLAELILGKPRSFSADQILSIEQFLTSRINNFEED
jgi:hypothetical protein